MKRDSKYDECKEDSSEDIKQVYDDFKELMKKDCYGNYDVSAQNKIFSITLKIIKCHEDKKSAELHTNNAHNCSKLVDKYLKNYNNYEEEQLKNYLVS